jgi:hypothetical protein
VSTTPGAPFHWDPPGRLWIFSLSTRRGRHVLLSRLNDASAFTFNFTVKTRATAPSSRRRNGVNWLTLERLRRGDGDLSEARKRSPKKPCVVGGWRSRCLLEQVPDVAAEAGYCVAEV